MPLEAVLLRHTEKGVREDPGTPSPALCPEPALLTVVSADQRRCWSHHAVSTRDTCHIMFAHVSVCRGTYTNPASAGEHTLIQRLSLKW